MADVFHVESNPPGAMNAFIAATAAARGSKPVFAYFYAKWCPDCSRSTPLIDSAFDSLPGATLIKVDIGHKGEPPYTDQNVFRNKGSHLRAAMAPYDLKCFPTLMLIGSDKRLDSALEAEQDATKGQALVDAFVVECVKQNYFTLPQYAAVGISLAALTAAFAALRK